MMLQLADTKDIEAYALSAVHNDQVQAKVLTIARPAEESREDQSTDARFTQSGIHFRQGLPSIQYTSNGSRLTLTSLNTRYPATVFACGSKIKDVGLHDDSSNLIVYVFMETYMLYSMILKPEHLENPSLAKEHGWITEHLAPSFQIRSPLFMQSITATNVIFALQDGGLLRLSTNGNGYNEHIFSDSSYFSSFKSILPWAGRPTNLVVSMAALPTKNLLFTLSVDAKLKAWDISKGQLLAVNDIYPAEQPPNFLLDPIRSSFIAVQEQATSFTLVTYCPQRPGFFKLFQGHGSGLQEVFSFREEQPKTGLWKVFDLTIQSIRNDGFLVLHILWKLDTLTLIQTAYVSPSQNRVRWRFDNSATSAINIPALSAESIEEFIFTPLRFSSRTIRQALRSSSITVHESDDLETLLLKTKDDLNNACTMEIDDETGIILQEKFDEDRRLKYLNLAQICTELDRVAGEPHSICTNNHTNETLIAHTGKVSFLRMASALEVLLQDFYYPQDPESRHEQSMLQDAITLKESLNNESWYSIARILRQECLTERTLCAEDSMYVAFERTIENQLPAAIHTTLHGARDQNGHSAVLDTFDILLSRLTPRSMRRTTDGILGLDAYLAQHHSLNKSILENIVPMITLLLHLTWTENNTDIARASRLYIRYLEIFRQACLVRDSMTLIPAKSASNESQSTGSRAAQTPGSEDASFPGDRPLLYWLTLSNDGNISTREFLDQVLVYLLNAKQPKLILHFSQFVTQAPHSNYYHARGLLLNGDAQAAGTLFARVARPLVSCMPTKSERRLEVKLLCSDLAEYYLHVAGLFGASEHHQQSLRFCREALLASEIGGSDKQLEIRQNTFTAALGASAWHEAYSVMASDSRSIQTENIRRFITSVCEASQSAILSSLPFMGLLEDVDTALERKSHNMLDVRAKPSYHKILYAFRIHRSDYRGAASIIYHRLQFLQNRSHLDGFNVADHLEITEGYLAIINALRCVSKEDAYIIVGSLDHRPTNKKTKVTDSDLNSSSVSRKLLKLDDIKEEYSKELHNMQVQLKQLASFGN